MTITVVTPVSPIPSHPDISILAETVASVEHHLPCPELVLLLDGVRPEQEHRRTDYEEAIRRIFARWRNDARICLFDLHQHQVGMLRAVIDEIDTPLLLFVEQDTPLELDPIDWDACSELILSGEADVVRLYHESTVPDVHQYLMREQQGEFLRTVQFSARPHLAATSYYRRILKDHFSTRANCFVEDRMHSVCQSNPEDHKLFIYTPTGGFRRSCHLDGRSGGPKFDTAQVF